MGLLSGLGKAIKKVTKKITLKGVVGTVKTVASGGLVGGIAAAGSKIAQRIGRKNLKRVAVGGAVLGAGAATTGLISGGADVGERRRYRRINPGNTRAMRRAIRRIEQGARLYSKFFSFRKGSIKGARGVRVKKLSIRRAS